MPTTLLGIIESPPVTKSRDEERRAATNNGTLKGSQRLGAATPARHRIRRRCSMAGTSVQIEASGVGQTAAAEPASVPSDGAS